MDDKKLEVILDKHQRDPACLLAILQDVQREENYLPKADVQRIAKAVGVSTSRVYSLATFFKSFSLKPRGKHICTVCMGTACHVRGAPKLTEHVEREFKIKAGDTTADMKITLETVNCVGACALGPLVIVDGEYHGNMTSTKLDRVLDPIKRG